MYNTPNQVFPKVGENKQGGKTGGDFKVCGNKLILHILELQMKSKKKGLKHISVILKLTLDTGNLEIPEI